MSDLKLVDSTWDLEISNADLVIITQKDALRQFLKQRLQMFFGEWFLDSSLGVPYFQEIMTKQPAFEAVDAIFKRQILETPGITQLDEFNLEYDNVNRTLSLSFRANSTEGVIDFNEEVSI
jgi:hypothetical protein